MIDTYDMQFLEHVNVRNLILQCPVFNTNTYIDLITDLITTVHRKLFTIRRKYDSILTYKLKKH